MSEYLDRKQVIELYEKYHPRLATCVYEFGQELRKLPIVERPRGEWVEIKTEYGTTYLGCSNCSWENEHRLTHLVACPNCGADMKEGEAE